MITELKYVEQRIKSIPKNSTIESSSLSFIYYYAIDDVPYITATACAIVIHKCARGRNGSKTDKEEVLVPE